jgi:hypothetical protein
MLNFFIKRSKVVIDCFTNNLNAFDLEEGMLDGSDEIDSPVANAILRRILMQRVDLLAKYGPEKVSDAICCKMLGKSAISNPFF